MTVVFHNTYNDWIYNIVFHIRIKFIDNFQQFFCNKIYKATSSWNQLWSYLTIVYLHRKTLTSINIQHNNNVKNKIAPGFYWQRMVMVMVINPASRIKLGSGGRGSGQIIPVSTWGRGKRNARKQIKPPGLIENASRKYYENR